MSDGSLRSPTPRWAWLALGGIVVSAVVLYTAQIAHVGFSTYYAAGAKSMAENARAFFFGALDPRATSTLDKLSGFLVPQALAIDLFGFHAWALALPQVIEGAVTVIAGFLIGVRWRGPVYGVAIAGLLAFTPMLAAMFGRPMEDGLLTMCQVLAFAALQRAMASDRMRWLLVSAAWVAVGFQAKMLQSWLFLPVLVVGYLLASRRGLGIRVLRAGLACAAAVALSVSWMAAIEAVPAADRPYVDGSTNDNMFSMVFGYNGVDRILPGAIPGAVPQLDAVPHGGQSSPNRTVTESAGHSTRKLLMPQFTTQIGWLYPAAIAGGVIGVLQGLRRRRRRADAAELAVPVALVTAAVVPAAVFSVAFVPHATYFAVLALPLAALATHGAVTALRWLRVPGARRLLFPALVVVQSLWAVVVIAGGAPVMWPLIALVAVAAMGALLALVAARMLPLQRGAALRAAAVIGVLAALVGPVGWSLCVLGHGGAGCASDAFAGPRVPGAGEGAGSVSVSASGALHPAHHAPTVSPAAGIPGVTLSAADRRLVAYTSARTAAGDIPFATDTMAVAVAVQLATTESPLTMGGFSRSAPHPSRAALAGLVESHRLRFVLLRTTLPSDDRTGPTLAADRAWVLSRCTAVLTGRFRDGYPYHQTLWDCARAR